MLRSTSSYAKRYKDELDLSKAIIELLLDHVDRYHNTMTQTNYAILQDRQLENELLEIGRGNVGC